ncbi:VacJ family lipoprotein [Paraburkholderia sp. NMBU_R16]|uniref:MlaA family lipoprotein n=1 Tax=Paraburkholderia sp. NMBU_R16 TaxID=2698676 RepID=UPI001563900B|nr:VacJ family lipoprotein [Paraburkholderia sp. NMBU_R16]NRO98568.1 VacJ family lipoprotein [Paraburkholderia sp. NMBU_R16]
MDKLRTLPVALGAAIVLAGCASAPNRTAGDPLEPMNRAIFRFNDAVDKSVAVPIAKGYQKITPHPLRTAISNFFSNLGDLTNVANELLQLRITDATSDLMRFTMNTTFGVGGLIDFATLARLPKHHQDFGLTLGRWGIPSGPYLVLPIFGPSTFRDSVGLAVDVRFNPLNYIEPAARTPLYILQFVSVRSDMLGATNILEQAALDKYSFVRDAYLQQRRSRLNTGGAAAAPALPNYGDEGESDSTGTTAAPAAASDAAPSAPAPASGVTPAQATPAVTPEPAAPASAPQSK